ncbi:MAG TPA: xanthine dehydrogenase family protein molybdopterin-binding subunit [Xanthobacteraceae bacterium]|nr:xanthine dehydrogenase family protein molybdopterin-binding subunit [Xanthobacteraceae bacterium]
MKARHYIGRSVPRLEDPPLVRGHGRFAGDISFPHQLHMRLVRSPIAHGRVVAVDTAAAGATPGVVAVWTAADVADVPPIDFREGRIVPLEPYRQPVLAIERVRYVGEPVAAVFATDPYIAEDAADLVAIAIEELPVLLDADAEPAEFSLGYRTEAAVVRQGYGDIDTAIARAHKVIALDLTVGRHSGVPIETRGAIGRYDAARDLLELHGAAKVPHRIRDLLALMLRRAPSSIHVHESHVGGGFGVRGELYPEDVLVCVAAMRLGRPIKWLEDRREHFICANHSRQQRHRVRAGVDADGVILALDDEFWHDQGAYVRTHATRVATMISGILPGPYRIPAYRSVGHFRLTNKTPAATYRAPGRYETTFVRERLVEAIAYALKLDPIEVRRRNAIPAAEMPFRRPLEVLGEEVEYDTGDYMGLLDKVLERASWPKLKADLARRRQNAELVGVGIAMYVEKSGLGPSDSVRIAVDTSGHVEVVTGGASVGQGFETVVAQVAAETIGLDYGRVRVVHGHTDRIPFGLGAHASRATVMTASATRVAALKLRDKALDMAAQLMQSTSGDLDIVDGMVVRKSGGSSMPLGAVVTALLPASPVRQGREPGLRAEGWFHTAHQVYPYGTHLAVVKVDPHSGAVAVERYIIGYDVGRAINPMLVEGQIMGGFVQGLGGALMEDFRYSERGDPLSVTFADYLMPTAREIPAVEIILTEDFPANLNPLGIKGAGESGITAVGAAIANAVEDAIGMPGAITELPITPQRLRAILDRHASLHPSNQAMLQKPRRE